MVEDKDDRIHVIEGIGAINIESLESDKDFYSQTED